MREDSFIKKLKINLCNKIFEKELDFLTTKIRVFVFVRDVKYENGIITLSGIRIAGVLHGGVYPKPTEMSEVSYKLSLEKGGVTAIILHNALWTVLNSRLKHFNLIAEDVQLKGKAEYLSQKRFFKHTKIYMTLDSTKN
jgi:hypothetical protein